MLRNYLSAALHNLVRSKLYAGISILGLAVGLCTTILVSLVVRNQVSYDHFIPGYERTYLAVSVAALAGRELQYGVITHQIMASIFRLKFNEVEAVTRLADQEVTLRRGQIESKEMIYWADPNLFDVLPLPMFAGDRGAALGRPDAIVLTRSIARKYFSNDDPVGQTILLDGQHNMTVTAVIQDLPSNGTTLESGIFASGLASYSKLADLDDDPPLNGEQFTINVRTYLRLVPGASIDRLQASMPEIMDSLVPRRPPGLDLLIQFVRIDRIHLFAGLNPGISDRLTVMLIVGILILFIACVNFVNLFTARSARRALEVAVRKVSGGSRTALITQFLAESLVYVVLATFIAVVLVEILLPHVNAFLDVGGTSNYARNPVLIAWLFGGVIIISVLAGIYPAFVLSSFRPAAVLKGFLTHSEAAVRTRYALVVLQFAVLVGLIIAAAVIYQQRDYAMRDALPVSVDRILAVRSPCDAAFKAELEALPEVRGVSCTSQSFLGGMQGAMIPGGDKAPVAVNTVRVDSNFLDVFGLAPVAGRFFPKDLLDEVSPSGGGERYIINQVAVKRLGFVSPEAAIGQHIMFRGGGEIIGVIPDFSLMSVKQEINPLLYYGIAPNNVGLVNVSYTGRNMETMLGAIDRLWTTHGGDMPIDRFFLTDHIRTLYLQELREAQIFVVFSCIAVLVASLGLIGLAAYTVERRAKEIAVRKVMGATTAEISGILILQLCRPVFFASLIAWPLSYYVMYRWLQTFAYRVELRPWVFIAATSLALVIALLVVSVHVITAARASLVAALKYE